MRQVFKKVSVRQKIGVSTPRPPRLAVTRASLLKSTFARAARHGVRSGARGGVSGVSHVHAAATFRVCP